MKTKNELLFEPLITANVSIMDIKFSRLITKKSFLILTKMLYENYKLTKTQHDNIITYEFQDVNIKLEPSTDENSVVSLTAMESTMELFLCSKVLINVATLEYSTEPIKTNLLITIQAE